MSQYDQLKALYRMIFRHLPQSFGLENRLFKTVFYLEGTASSAFCLAWIRLNMTVSPS